MRKEVKFGLVVLASVTLGAVLSWVVLGLGSARTSVGENGSPRRVAKCSRAGDVKKITEISIENTGDRRSVRIIESESDRPNVLELSEDSDEQLTEAQRSVLREIQAALDADDLKALRKAVSKFTASVKNGGLGGLEKVPASLRSAAVQALGWFGKDAAVDLVDFVADADEDIASDAYDQFDLALQDPSLSDYERAAIVKTMGKALMESDWIDSLLMSLNDMRNSVKAETAIVLLTDGSDKVKSAMQEELEFHFDGDVQSIDDIKKWLAENPDDPDDDDLYGGDKDE